MTQMGIRLLCPLAISTLKNLLVGITILCVCCIVQAVNYQNLKSSQQEMHLGANFVSFAHKGSTIESSESELLVTEESAKK
jgi:hypothetical protein